VRGYVLELERVYELFRKLRSMSAADILNLSTVMEGRADVMTAGALILREIMAHFKFQTMTVSERGVRFGLVLREWERRNNGNHAPSSSSGQRG
jgi:exopolyphosphatase/guanosine-5'-triphosphate,3'-diphosphate pyrophosphatase